MRIGDYDIRTFVVTLQEMPEKWDFISKHLVNRGIDAEPFNGISAAVSGLRTIFPYERDAPGSGWNIGQKPVATWLSFYMLFSAMSVAASPYFMSLEWDACFPDNWRQRTEDALRDAPRDFDLLYLGSCCCAEAPKNHVKGEVWDVRWPLCGHATIIAKKAIPTILRTQRRVYAPWDISLLLHTLPHLKVFTVLPSLVSQFGTALKP